MRFCTDTGSQLDFRRVRKQNDRDAAPQYRQGAAVSTPPGRFVSAPKTFGTAPSAARSGSQELGDPSVIVAVATFLKSATVVEGRFMAGYSGTPLLQKLGIRPG